MNAYATGAQQIHERSIAGQGSRGAPASSLYLRQEIQEAALRSSEFAELIQKENVHIAAVPLLTSQCENSKTTSRNHDP